MERVVGPRVLGRAVVVDEVGLRTGPGGAQRLGLRLAPALGDRLGDVREQDGQPQPDRDGPGEQRADRRAGGHEPLHGDLADRQDRGEGRADPDEEDHRVAPLLTRVELGQGPREGRPQLGPAERPAAGGRRPGRGRGCRGR
ncbi:hypothetical protein SDC9_172146 [bioreactor metagenome]|uniref:Uncharacterized protein n=1 Tax=bioreactor metagenome TaxID=1076179 RepID=A0A645GLC5_9ZZZZ